MSNKIPASAIKSGNISGQGLREHQLHRRSAGRRCAIVEKLSGNPLVLGVAGAALATANAGDIDYLHDAAGNYWSFVQHTAQTLFPRDLIAADLGMEIALDQVDNETVEYTLGGNSARNPFGWTVGTDDFYFECGFNITDASGSDQFGVLIRKQEAYTAPTSFLTTGDGIYTDFVLFGFAATKADPNPVNISYDLNNSGSATVQAANFTWADGKTHRLGIAVVKRKCYFFINGVGLGGRVTVDGEGGDITDQSTVVGPSITLDSGDFFIPGIFCRQDTDLTPIYLRSYKAGTLADLGMNFAG